MQKSSINKLLIALSIALIMASLYMVFIFVPTEKVMGIVQRLFYLMVPMAWLAMLSFVVIFISSIMYLRSQDSRWSTLGRAAAECGIVFTGLTLMIGMLWAKPAWGVWWTWEPRLTATLVLFFIYIAYFLVPAMANEKARAATFAAVIGILGFVDIPIIGMATTLWRSVHPQQIIFEGGLAPSMLATLIVSIFAYTSVFVLLLRHSVALKNSQADIRRLKQLEDNS